MPVDTSYLLLFLSQSKDPSARTPQHRAESCQASTWRLDLISHVLSNYVLQKKDVKPTPHLRRTDEDGVNLVAPSMPQLPDECRALSHKLRDVT